MMRFRAFCFAILAAGLLPAFLNAQSTSTAPQAVSLLRKSLAAQTGGAAITDVTMSGTAAFLHGSNSQTGTVTLTALANGTSRSVFNMPGGTSTEVWSPSRNGDQITAAGPNGALAETPDSSVTMVYPAWFSPTILTAFVSGSGYASSYMGSETRDGASVVHVIAWQTPTQDFPVPNFVLKQRTQCDLYLDPATSLPVSAVFQVWPTPPPGEPLSIRARPALEEVRYSDYQNVEGRAVPLRMQIYLESNEIIDITISSVAFNTGATITAPN